MSDLPHPKRVQLTPPGPYILQEAQGFLALAIAQGQLPIQLRFVLGDGQELHLPISNIALGRLYAALKGHFGEKAP